MNAHTPGPWSTSKIGNPYNEYAIYTESGAREGSSTFPSGFVHEHKAIVARVSYNGRVWNPDNDTLIQEAAQ